MDKRLTAMCLAATMFCGLPALAQQPADDGEKMRASEPKKDEKADQPTLKVGDKAPALAVGKWVKGEPITGFEKGRIYVVEAWATWCGPCIAAIPHLSDLQAEYKDKGVTVVGVSVWENDQSKVEPFVKGKGDKMNYTVSMDDVAADADSSEGKFAKTWMAAAQRKGIPSSFVVDRESRIAWIGHPMNGLDRVVEELVAGTFDIQKEAERAAQEARKEAAEVAVRTEMSRIVRSARANNDWNEAIPALDKLMKDSPDAAAMIGVQKFMILFTQAKDYPAATAWAKELGEKHIKDDAMALNQVAWTMIDPDMEGVDQHDYALAEKLATRACELTNFENAMILDTLALACFENGKVARAIELQSKAVELAPEGDMKEELSGRLERFKAKRPNS